MRKAERHALIKQIIRNNVIRNQTELLTFLKKQNVKVTQPTISRDIRDLKIVKTADEDGETYFEIFEPHVEIETATPEQRLVQVIADVAIKIEHVHFLTVIHTQPDHATLLCSIIDETALPQKVCSIAGFDTVIIITPSDKDAAELAQHYQQYIQ